ncbi:MAG: TetR/AcrR family transcriptional regulator [Firmicutes bacterium]|nr:TetR/AcrR family transcriptional regulator [Bacillota bacterium]
MPAGFTDTEKQKIKEGLIEEGRKLFSQYGLRKTTIKDITGAVGIAQGSFYNFYASKEELYFEILDLESREIREHMEKDLDLIKDNPRAGLKKMIFEAYMALGENDLFKDLFSGSYDLLLRKLPEEKIKEHMMMDYASLKPLIIKWQNEGVLKRKNPQAITGLFHVLFYIALHKKEFGENYKDTFELLLDLIVDGLVEGERE